MTGERMAADYLDCCLIQFATNDRAGDAVEAIGARGRLLDGRPPAQTVGVLDECATAVAAVNLRDALGPQIAKRPLRVAILRRREVDQAPGSDGKKHAVAPRN